IVEVLPDEDEEGNPLLDRNGQVKMVNYARFFFRWKKDHYDLPAKHFITPKASLSRADHENYKKMEDLANSIPKIIYTDGEGNDLRDKNGSLVTKRNYINTKSLLACRTKEEVAACFHSTVPPSVKEKEKRARDDGGDGGKASKNARTQHNSSAAHSKGGAVPPPSPSV
ncbi:hypothetical protein A2U01_0036604, partial [Trifolium medium]|nr:hypothetical protein [Trifolium medium]